MKKITLNTNEEKDIRVVVAKGEKQQIVEIVTKDSVQNRKVEVRVEDNAQLEYIYLLDEGVSPEFIEERVVELGTHSKAKTFYCFFGGSQQSVTIHNKIGEQAELEHRVLFFASTQQEFKFKERHQFLRPEGYGKFLSHGFLSEKSKSQYDSMIIIDPYAQKVDSRLDLHSYVLGQRARSVMVPSLQIEANDVKAGHGATVAYLDDESMFYLRSRGLTQDQAMHLFIDGLFNDFVEQFECDIVKDRILEILQKKY